MQLSPISTAQARLHLADDDISDDNPAPKPKAKAAAEPTADSAIPQMMSLLHRANTMTQSTTIRP